VEARFTEENVSSNLDPTDHPFCQKLHLFVRKIHEQPVGENQVKRSISDLEVRGCNISTHKLDILVMPIDTFILQERRNLTFSSRLQIMCNEAK
jgi:hypothetical protein